MYELKIENFFGDVYTLTNRKDEFYVLDVQGLTFPKATINTKESAIIDGSFYNSSKVGERNIVINFLLTGDIEASRHKIYKIFPIKKELTLYFKNKTRSLKIKGYPELIEGDLFVQREQIQVSIICPRPYFELLHPISAKLSRITNNFQFPFEIEEAIAISEINDYPVLLIENPGDVSCGCMIDIKIDPLEHPINNFRLINGATNSVLEVIAPALPSIGNEMKICTIPGQLSARNYNYY